MSSIEWTDATWNPIRARRRADGKPGWYCNKVSPACKFCYAEKMNQWRGNQIKYAADKLDQVEMYLDEKTLYAPRKWREPRMVFVCSMTDLWGEPSFIDPAWTILVYEEMARNPQHIYQVLTKRPERRLAAFQMWSGTPELARLLRLPNVWEGTSIGTQAEMTAQAETICRTPAAHTWLSIEPMLEAIVITGMVYGCMVMADGGMMPWRPEWVVCGGESGQQARPFNVQWGADLARQCRTAHVPFFWKQMGSLPVIDRTQWMRECARHRDERLKLADWRWGVPIGHCRVEFEGSKGQVMTDWPKQYQIREWPKSLAGGKSA